MTETDAMQCRACLCEERASEGYPCKECGTFICNMCVLRGVVRCRACAAKGPAREGDPLPETSRR